MVVLKGLTCPRNMNWLGDGHGGGYLGMITPPPKDTGTSSWPQSASATPATRADGHSKSLTPTDQSIDQLLLNQIPALKGRPVSSVQLTASTESSDQTGDLHCLRVTSYKKGAGTEPTPLWPESSPAAAFKNYFGSSLMNLTPDQQARAAAQQKSVLDFAMGSYSSLQSQMPKSQLRKLQRPPRRHPPARDDGGGDEDRRAAARRPCSRAAPSSRARRCSRASTVRAA